MSYLCGIGGAPADALRILSGLIACCVAAAEHGATACTCWEPEYDLDQTEPDTTIEPSTRSAMCADCAYRPDSPERTGDPRYDHSEEGEVLDLAASPNASFWCHQGIRKPVRWRHPLGIVIEVDVDHYAPPIADQVPYKADGTPGDRCAGWAAHRRIDVLVVADVLAEVSR